MKNLHYDRLNQYQTQSKRQYVKVNRGKQTCRQTSTQPTAQLQTCTQTDRSYLWDLSWNEYPQCSRLQTTADTGPANSNSQSHTIIHAAFSDLTLLALTFHLQLYHVYRFVYHVLSRNNLVFGSYTAMSTDALWPWPLTAWPWTGIASYLWYLESKHEI